MQFSHRFVIYFIMLLRMFLMHAFIMSPHLSLAFCNNFHLFCWDTNLSFNTVSYFPFWQLFNFDSSFFHLFLHLSFLKLTAEFPANGRNMPDNTDTFHYITKANFIPSMLTQFQVSYLLTIHHLGSAYLVYSAHLNCKDTIWMQLCLPLQAQTYVHTFMDTLFGYS